MRRGVETLLLANNSNSRASFIQIKDSSSSSSMIDLTRTLLQRLNEETERNRLLQLTSLRASVGDKLIAIAKGSGGITSRLDGYLENSEGKGTESFLLDWVRCVLGEIQFLNELRVQRDELFEMYTVQKPFV